MNYGYLPISNQPLFLAHFNIKMPPKVHINIDKLDNSLKSIFHIESNSYVSKNNDIYKLIIRRYLLLANVLQSFSGIPSFYIDKVAKYSLDNNGLINFYAYIPNLEYINKSMRIKLYNASEHIINLILKNNTDKLYLYLDEINKVYIQKFRAINGQYDSTIPILEGAYSQNIPIMQLSLNVFQLGWGSKSILLKTSIVDEDSIIGSSLSCDKLLSKMILRKIGCPVPSGSYIDNIDNLITCANKINFPVVIKPIDRDRSEGVTTDIKNYDQLQKAYSEAVKFSKKIMIEEHIDGDVYRIALIHNNLIYVVKRLPKGVYGDGERTIASLIDKANLIENKKAPWLRLKPFPKDQSALDSLYEQKVSMETVVDKGKYVYLRKIQSNQDGGGVENFTEIIHPDNIKLANKISNMFRIKSIGIDFITTDISKPWYETNGKILELNYSPLVADRFQSWGHKSSKKFISSCFPMGTRVPIDLYIGGSQAWDAAKEGMQQLNDKQINFFMTDHLSTYDSKQEKIEMITQSFYHRIQALLTDTTLDQLIIIIQTNELLETGVPFDQVSNLFIVDHTLQSFKSNEPLSPKKANDLIDFFSTFLIRAPEIT
jgi:cyanophycin synthetase